LGIRNEAMQYDVFPERLHLRRTDLPRNMNRFYEIVVQRDLFGAAVLSCEWGRIGSPGRVRQRVFVDEGQAVNALLDVARVKKGRGYRVL